MIAHRKSALNHFKMRTTDNNTDTKLSNCKFAIFVQTVSVVVLSREREIHHSGHVQFALIQHLRHLFYHGQCLCMCVRESMTLRTIELSCYRHKYSMYSMCPLEKILMK